MTINHRAVNGAIIAFAVALAIQQLFGTSCCWRASCRRARNAPIDRRWRNESHATSFQSRRSAESGEEFARNTLMRTE
jgi:hypothetical protein